MFNWENFSLSKFNQKGIAQIVLMLIILVGIILSVYVVQKSGFQLFKPKADEQNISFINGNCVQSQNGKQVLTCAGPVQFKLVSPLDASTVQSAIMSKPDLSQFSLVKTAYASENLVGDSCQGTHVYNGQQDQGDCGWFTERCGEIPLSNGNTIATCFDRFGHSDYEIGKVCTTDGQLTSVKENGDMSTRSACGTGTCQMLSSNGSSNTGNRFNAACVITCDHLVDKNGNTISGITTLTESENKSDSIYLRAVDSDNPGPADHLDFFQGLNIPVAPTDEKSPNILDGYSIQGGIGQYYIALRNNGVVQPKCVATFNLIADPVTVGGTNNGSAGGSSAACPTSIESDPQCGGTTGLEDTPWNDPTHTIMVKKIKDCNGNLVGYDVNNYQDLGDLGQCGLGNDTPGLGGPAAEVPAANSNDCNPVPDISAPNGYRWEANCGQSCSQNSDCPPSTDPYANSNSSYWCYGFANGNRCLALKYIGGGNSTTKTNSTPVVAAPSAPALSSNMRVTKWYRFADNTVDLLTTPFKPYTLGGVTDQITFKDFAQNTTKSLFVQFEDNANPPQIITADTGLNYFVASIDTTAQPVATNSPLFASCSVTSTAVTNETVKFIVSVSSGRDQYIYNWTGDDGILQRDVSQSNTDLITKKFDTTGTKQVAVTVSSGSDTVTANCLPVQVTNPNDNPAATACTKNNYGDPAVEGKDAWCACAASQSPPDNGALLNGPDGTGKNACPQAIQPVKAKSCSDYYGSLVSHCGSMTYPICDVNPETFCVGKSSDTEFTCHAAEDNLCTGSYKCGSCATSN